MRLIILLTVIITFPAIGFSMTIHVPGDYPTIQQAIDASVNGDTVLVAPGTYVENIDFKGKAITVMSDQGPDLTVIDGGNPVNPDIGSVVTFKSGEGKDSVITGFSITNGTGTNTSMSFNCGGGMVNFSTSPTVINCNFISNKANHGGGMYNNDNSTPTVIYCNFIANESFYNGGGMANDGGSGSTTVTDCNFIGNLAVGVPGWGGGGGMYNVYCSPIVTNCVFSKNWTPNQGGGGMINMYSGPTVTNCTFSGNWASGSGGGIKNFREDSIPTIINCTFVKNLSYSGCGAMSNIECSTTVTNCIFILNSGIHAGGISNSYCSSKVTNCILWDNNGEIYNNNCTPIVTYCDVKGGYPGTGNIDSDPLFVDPANGDYHLTFNSPCRGSGDNSAVNELTDFEGDPRIAYGTVDMGADEFYTHLYYTGDATPGGNVEIKFVGLPGTAPVGLCIGTGVLDPPLKSMWGDWYLAFPIIGPIGMPQIPSTGVLIVPGTIPASPPAPYSLPMQALIGAELTNLSVLKIK